MLTEDEFSSVFAGREDELEVKRSCNVVIITPKDGGACPHWRDGGCSIYQRRPIDCRLHPYMMTHIIQRRNSVKITYHNINDCPRRDMLMTEADAGALVKEFGKKAYGEDRTIVAQCESGKVTRLLNRLEESMSDPRFNIHGD